ncbi:type I DNA topoisomerase [Herbivorax sp. ANBcel31]|uniref:type I DNA topoisomerase n=1 Tax=Herbivorax sp. ANBcel31 TaxID=3069754 RepID=UPI0027B79D23|nr:type I DNA topoisomerase [Herbivorax sp. ANBcel31]MDQ2085902.1 type I DNA topoisomerase [Herbivorax sp. ANBcel31]
MADKLVIVESPAKANTIKKFLGRNYKIVASVGHVRDLPKSQIGVDLENHFTPKYITIRGKGEVISKLKKEAKKAKKIYLATDPDREGEAISWHLAYLLKLDDTERCRITFNEITKNAVKNSIKSPREIDMSLVDAQQARRILDRIVGYKISPLLWKKVKKGLSAGRVQSVATRLICDREEEIDDFVPDEYWSITAELKKEKVRKHFNAKFHGIDNKKLELKSEKEVNKVLKEIEKEEFKVKKIKKSQKKKSPPAPFITSTLQQDASRKLGYSTKKTMIVAQQLYEGISIEGVGTTGLITYIRTDSTRISDEAMQDTKSYIEGNYGEKYLPDKKRTYKNKSKSQDAHECIRPTDVNIQPDDIKSSLSREQYRLYKLIWGRFVASQMAHATYDTISVDINVGRYLFKSSGSSIKFKGFIVLYKESKDNESEEENLVLPELSEGEQLKKKSVNPKQHFTQPPPRYTEAALVKALEERGIGRPSTYAPTISTILSRGYVVKESKALMPTELGKIVNDIMKKYFHDIVDVEFTVEMERKLDDIEEGGKKWEEIIENFYAQFVHVLNDAEEKIGNIEIPDEVTDEICEKCGRNMVIKMGRYGKFLACPGFPECRNAKPILEDTGVKCPKCKGKVYIKKTRKGRKYLGCENNPECDFMTWEKPSKEECPDCGNFLTQKYSGKKAQLKCSNEDCDFDKIGEDEEKK